MNVISYIPAADVPVVVVVKVEVFNAFWSKNGKSVPTTRIGGMGTVLGKTPLVVSGPLQKEELGLSKIFFLLWFDHVDKDGSRQLLHGELKDLSLTFNLL